VRGPFSFLTLPFPLWLRLTLLALLYTLFNAAKPLTIDDTAYYHFAVQIARAPLDPYGGSDLFWYQWPHRPFEILAPPLLPYWWALGLHLLGDEPVLWKLWLFPFSLLFVVALHSLFRRFARGLEEPLVVLTVFSPPFLPSLNLMLDVPALALSLAAVAAFLGANDRRSFVLALLAGLLAGLAMQTKYTGFLAPAVMLAAAFLVRGRDWLPALGRWLIAAGTAGILFVAWEAWIAQQYGESHFVYHARSNNHHLRSKIAARRAETADQGWLARQAAVLEPILEDKAILVPPLLAVLGGVTGGQLLLGLAALRGSRRLVLTGGTLLALGLLAIAAVPDRLDTFWSDPDSGQERLTLPNTIFGLLALVLGAVTAAAWWFLLRRRNRRAEGFLAAWLLLELVGYFALTPFCAVRRVMGIVVVVTLILGRLASRTCRGPQGQALVHAVVGFTVALGIGYYALDLSEAHAQRVLAEQAARWVCAQPRPPEATTWFVGHWGFQFYAERAGMKAVVPDTSLLRAGDWLVVPDERIHQQRIRLDPEVVRPAQVLSMRDGIPLRTVMCYYCGRVPLEHHEGPRLQVTIYEVREDFRAVTPH
jgi:hypothetical protein